MDLLDWALIGVCAVIRSNTLCRMLAGLVAFSPDLTREATSVSTDSLLCQDC